MAWFSGLFGSNTGLSDQDQSNLANQGLLQAGLGILAANGQPGVTPFQAISGGLLGGLNNVQQGASNLQNQQYKNSIMQSTMADAQRKQKLADLAQKFVRPDGSLDMQGYQQALAGIDPQAAFDLQKQGLGLDLLKAQVAQKQAKPTRELNSGSNVLTQEMDPASGQWSTIATAPRWQPQSGSSAPTALERNVDFLMKNGATKQQALAANGIVIPGTTGSGMTNDGTQLNGQSFLDQLPQNDASQVKALADGRMAFPTGTALKSAYWQDMLQKVAQYDPTFDAVNYNARSATRKAFTSGKEGQTVNALNTVAEHLGQLSDAAQSLNNTSLQSLNSAKNWIANQTGDPDIARFNTTAKAAADEVAKVWRASGGSEADIQENLKNLSSSQSPAQLNAAIGTLTNLIGGKISALQDQYAQGMGTTQQVKPLVSQKAAGAFQKTLNRAGYTPDVNYSAQLPGANPLMSSPKPNAGWSIQQVGN